jgi:hypothetical protein
MWARFRFFLPNRFFLSMNQGRLFLRVTHPAQVAHLITKVGELLEKYGSGWEKAARIHLCVTSSEVEKEARMVTDVVFRDTPMTWVVSKLPKEGAVIAIDVVAATEFGEKGGPGVKVLPAGCPEFLSPDRRPA